MAGRKPIEANKPEAIRTALDAQVAAGLIQNYGELSTTSGHWVVAGGTLVELRTPREANAFLAGLRVAEQAVTAPAPSAPARTKATSGKRS